jgi:RimJ/RimL family protein N-acetyltransferase
MPAIVPVISLVPLTLEHHVDALQQVYRATPGYWQMYGLPSSPAGQAERDLQASQETPGRTLMGIVRHTDAVASETPDVPSSTASLTVEMIGMIDFRLHWPAETVVYIGLMMVAQPYQRRGIGSQAWRLLEPWLASAAQMTKARLGVEQFNPGALQFFQHLGFALTGESNRVRSGTKWVRVLYMERDIGSKKQE